MNEYKNKKIALFETQKDFEKWMEGNNVNQVGIWIEFFNKGKGKSLTYQEALDIALCFGWIDGQIKKIKEDRCMRSFTPRRKGSVWSKTNVEHCERLIKEGRMKMSGLIQIEAAKTDGRWERAYVSSSKARLPEDLVAEISKDKRLVGVVEKMKKAEIYSIYFQLSSASNPDIRMVRFQKIMLQLKEKII